MQRGLIAITLLLALALCGCPADTHSGSGGHSMSHSSLAGPVRVWADPALKTALDKLEPDFKKKHPTGWEVAYKESADIAKLSAADHPDVVLTVEPVAQKLFGGGVVDESTARTFAGDMLTVITSRSKPLSLAKLGDLVMTAFKGLGVGADGTSEGYYAQQALLADGAKAKIKDQIKPYASMDELVAAVGSASIDFGMVYASTAAQHKEVAIATVVPEDLYEDIKYVAVASKDAAKRHGVVELLKLLGEDAATQKLLGSYGYMDRAAAMIDNK